MLARLGWVRRSFARGPKRVVRRLKLCCEPLERRDTPTFIHIGVAFRDLSFIGNSDADDLLVTVGADGFFRHNLVQSDLASDADFDNFTLGEQRLTLDDVGVIQAFGQGGDDRIQIDAPVSSFLHGDDGNDILIGGPADDILLTGVGTDTYDGRGGNDASHFFSFSAVNAAVIADTGATVTGAGFTATGVNVELYEILGTAGDDTLDASGFTGSVSFNAQGGNNVLIGGAGNDLLFGEDGDDIIQGLGGDDIIEVGAGANAFGGGPGTDSLGVPFDSAALVTNTLLVLDGSAFADHGFEHIALRGTDAPAVVFAAGFTIGSIEAWLGAGNDVVIGTPGDDRIGVGDGNNLVLAGAGDDSVSAGYGANYVLGGSGIDYLSIGVTGNATLTDTRLTIGGLTVSDHGFEAVDLLGSDLPNAIDSSQFDGPVFIDGAGGNDVITTGSGADSVFGGDGDDVIETGAGNDQAGGGPGNDSIRTRAGDDFIDFDGIDRVDGGSGTDGFAYAAAGTSVVLSDNALLVDGQNTSPNHKLEEGTLFAGPTSSTLDASRFSRGSITLYAGPGDDTLILGRFGGMMWSDLATTDTALIVGTNQDDDFTIDGSVVTVNGGAPVVMGNLFYFVELDGRGGADTFSGVSAVITGLRLVDIESHLNVGGDQTLNTGSFVRSGSFSDNGRGRPWTATVDFGDSTGDQPLTLNPDNTFTLDHTYTRRGSYTVRVTLVNDEGSTYIDTFELRVTQV